MSDYIYYDCNSTTQVSKSVLDKMIPYFTEHYGNASCAHDLGYKPIYAIKEAENNCLSCFDTNLQESSVIFTSGATESNNWVFNNALQEETGEIRILTTETEHSSISNFLKNNFRIHPYYIKVDNNGDIDVDDYIVKINTIPNITMVSMIWANNETGKINNIRALSKLAKERGVKYFHTDATQALGKIIISKQKYVDLFSFSSHKICGPKGVGGLLIKNHTHIKPMIFGGKQQNGLRAGTENIPGIVGLGQACKDIYLTSNNQMYLNSRKLIEYRNALDNVIKLSCYETGVKLIENSSSGCLNGVLNYSLPEVDTKKLLEYMSYRGIYFSAGSACNTGKPQPSNTIYAMGRSWEAAKHTIRLSFTYGNKLSEEEVDKFESCFYNYLREHHIPRKVY